MAEKIHLKSGLLCCALLLLEACATVQPVTTGEKPEKPETEFRAAWVATVANINWPSKPGLNTEEQQQEAIALLDLLQAHHFNAVIFQVRPQCDALYASPLEPWSYYLTGEQGKAPDPFYDPLEFWVKAAHDRGLELHVWLNPYRAHHKDGGEVGEHSIVKTRPELVVHLKTGYWWMDPAKKGTQDHSAAVVMDLVKRYDIDGVHFDDYFYPYPSYNENEDFPDGESWAEYQRSGGKLSRGDWRRNSVNVFIQRLYKEIKAEKPHVKFGLSPFGIWRPGYPESIRGFDQYDQLYADARLWLNKGWIDYFTPQLYWTINRIPQSYPVLLGWWAGENTKKRHLWPGIRLSRDTTPDQVNETINQIMITRGMTPQSKGVVHWSIGPLITNQHLGKALLAGPYQRQALMPPSPWLDKKAPQPPVVTTAAREEKLLVSWTHPDEKEVARWVVYCRYGDIWSYQIFPARERTWEPDRFQEQNPGANNGEKRQVPLVRVLVSAVDRNGNESVPAPGPINP